MIMLVAGIMPKIAYILLTIPSCVLGGATISVFAMISMTGIKLINNSKMNYRNTSIVGLAIALGMGVTQANASLAQFPEWVTTIFGKSPVALSTLVAVFLNLVLPKEKEEQMKILIRGAGDLATGIAAELWERGHQILMTDVAIPLTVRREVAFSRAVYEEHAVVEGIEAVLADNFEEAETIMATRKIAVMVDEKAEVRKEYLPDVLVDGIMAKKESWDPDQ